MKYLLLVVAFCCVLLYGQMHFGNKWNSIYQVSVRAIGPNRNKTNSNTTLCPQYPPGLVGEFNPNMTPLPFKTLNSLYPKVKMGGTFAPDHCKSRHRVAIIIPYRDREPHLKVLLKNLHLVLQKQLLDYTVYVVELALPGRYNKAMSMNAGVKEAMMDRTYQCVVFHDVDTIPQNDRNMYSCPDTPRHLAPAIERYHYKLLYPGAFGAVTAMKTEHFLKINGFSNKYFGWGQEDDDILRRIKARGLKMVRASFDVGRYRTIDHGRDQLNPPNPKNHALLKSASARMNRDGLNSVNYTLLKFERKPLYTWIYISS